MIDPTRRPKCIPVPSRKVTLAFNGYFTGLFFCTDDHRQAAHYAACFLRGRPFGQPPFLPASLIFFGSRALEAPRPRAPFIDAAALMTRSSWMSALQDGHFILMLLMYTFAQPPPLPSSQLRSALHWLLPSLCRSCLWVAYPMGFQSEHV